MCLNIMLTTAGARQLPRGLPLAHSVSQYRELCQTLVRLASVLDTMNLKHPSSPTVTWVSMLPVVRLNSLDEDLATPS
jgi:hypothetical protein